MKTVKIIDEGAILPKKEADRFSERVIAVIKDVLRSDFQGFDEYAASNVYELLDCQSSSPEKAIANAALILYHSDWKSIQDRMKRLKIVVEGYCPECGEELEAGSEETLPATDLNDACYIQWDYCTKCNYRSENY